MAHDVAIARMVAIEARVGEALDIYIDEIDELIGGEANEYKSE